MVLRNQTTAEKVGDHNMPFKKTGQNEFESPAGRKYTGRQVKLYYATAGFTKKPKSY